MNCDEFKIWILDKDVHDRTDDQAAEAHRSACIGCQAIYSLDATIEKQIKNELDTKVWTENGLVYAIVI